MMAAAYNQDFSMAAYMLGGLVVVEIIVFGFFLWRYWKYGK